MLPQNFVIFGSLIGTVGGLSYLVYTIQGKVKPNRVTFFLWAVAPLIAFAAELKQGVGIQSVLTLSVGLLPLLIFIGSFFNKQSEWKLTRFDIICGVLSVVGLIFWLVTQIGNIAITFSIISDGLAALPTIIKAYKYPETESGWTYLTATISASITLLTDTNWSYAQYAFPIYIAILNFIIFFLVQFKFGKKNF